METMEKHKKIWKIIVIVASFALILASFLPYLALLQ